jgi:hypothetical protein
LKCRRAGGQEMGPVPECSELLFPAPPRADPFSINYLVDCSRIF